METGEIVDLRLTRAKFLEHFANRAPCLVAMEACGGSQHWARRIRELGHEVRLLPAKMVRPFVGGNKNDAHDARAIWTAVQQPGVKTVAIKTEEQQAILALHRMRQQLVKFRTAQINGLRGLLAEYGEVMPQGRAGMRRGIGAALERVSERLPAMVIDTLREQWARVARLDEEIGEIERRLALWHRSNTACRRIAEIPGVGVLTATAAVAAMGDPAAFRSGREFAAWLGLVPRHSGTGGRVRVLGISKRGDRYLRTLLIHGARSVPAPCSPTANHCLNGRCAWLNGGRRTWPPLRWPTRWHARSGPCWPMGYEDLIDHDGLRHDPVLGVVLGRLEARRPFCAPLAGKSTLNRLEHAPSGAHRYRRIGHDTGAIEALFVDLFLEAHGHAPARLILDLDATDDPLHGRQEGRFFHGYYDCYCYLPLYIFCGDHLLAARLRRSDIDASAGAAEEVARIVGRIRERWPAVEIVLRANSGFAREGLMAWCEENGVDYVFGLGRNRRLVERIDADLAGAERDACLSGETARRFADFSWSTRKSWSRERRVVAKAEWMPGRGANPRFVVTSLVT